MNYVYNIRQALMDGETETLNQLIYGTSMAANSTWDLVYAYAGLNKALGLTDEQFELMMKNLDNLRSLQMAAISGIGQATGKLKEARDEANKTLLKELQDQERALNDLLKYVMDMIKWETAQRIQGIRDQITAFEELINLRKQELREIKKKHDFEKELEKQTKSLAKLQAELAKLERDNSGDPAIKAKKQALAEQIAEMQGNIDEKIYDKYVEEMENAYDQDLKIYRETKEAEIKILEDTISSTEKLYRLAIDRISNHWSTLFDDLINWNYQAGNTIERDLVSAWDNASLAVQRYGSYLEALLQTQHQISELSKSMSSSSYSTTLGASESSDYPTTVSNTGTFDNSGGTSAAAQEQAKQNTARSIVDAMKANSTKWHTSSDAEKKRLADDNERLALQLAAIIGRAVLKNSATGVWYIDNVGGEELYNVKKFSQGGVVDYAGLAEVHGSTSTPELMLNNKDVGKVYDLIHTADNLTDGMKEGAGEFRSALTDMRKMLDEVAFNSAFAQAMTQGGLQPNSQDYMWQDLMSSIAPKNYHTENIANNNTATVTIQKVEAPIMVSERLEKSDIMRFKGEIEDIALGAAPQAFRQQGIVNRGSAGVRKNI